MRAASSSPALRGSLVALLSAVAFGLTTPFVQKLAREAGPFATACLLYAGAAAVGLASRSKAEARVARMHLPRIVGVAVAGALIAPSLLAWGLAHASGTAASLMLNLEGVFTLALARIVHAEHAGRRVVVAAAIMSVGGALLVLDHARDQGGTASVIGLAAIAAASFAWAIDNTLAKPLAALDPASVVGAKATIGAVFAASLAVVARDRWPSPAQTLGLLAVGATGYGMSLRLYLRAQRLLGAGRTASVFASGPFWGAAVAWMLGEPAGLLTVVAALAMASGLFLHLTETHSHAHVHEPVEHEHPHRHDDGHHAHFHDPMPAGEHSHRHRHEHVAHEHPHVPDLHHEHGHAADEDVHDRAPHRDAPPREEGRGR